MPRPYASIYDHDTGAEITVGLQGCNVCDEAIQVAQRIADNGGEPVELHDDDGRWLVHPRKENGTREAADFLGGYDGDYAPIDQE